MKAERPPQLDTLVARSSFSVLAVDPSTQQVHLEGEPGVAGSSSFKAEGVYVRVEDVDGPVCKVSEEDLAVLHEGVEVEQEQFLSEPDSVFQEFIRLWRPRWNQHEDVGPEHWHRVLNFARFLTPIASFDFPAIHRDQWLQAVRKLKKQAARGPDGYARADLLNMAPSYVDQLLAFLHAVERGAADWPLQLLQGFVWAVDKQNQKTGADAYRPICVLSVIYRIWASIRTKQLLHALAPYLPDEQFGFVPGRETADLWFRLQARVELSCQQGMPLTGCVADVIKAFNGLPRAPLLQAAVRLGFPTSVLHPWASFISQVQRRFVMGQAVSEAVGSCSGFIEGDPLSVTAMTVASVLYHRYLHHFEPRIQHASYVDNLMLTANSVYLAARGHVLMESFWHMLGLQLDHCKTYFWATLRHDRKFLTALGMQVVEHCRELGGFLNFGPRRRIGALMHRVELLQPFWVILRRCRAPARQKWAAITTKLWPIVFHGTATCWMPEVQLDKLRTKMAWALGWTCSGAGPDLRALTEGPAELDPAYFQMWVRDFRRLAPKCVGFRRDWEQFMLGFDGRGLLGRFPLCSITWSNWAGVSQHRHASQITVASHMTCSACQSGLSSGFCRMPGRARFASARLRAVHSAMWVKLTSDLPEKWARVRHRSEHYGWGRSERVLPLRQRNSLSLTIPRRPHACVVECWTPKTIGSSTARFMAAVPWIGTLRTTRHCVTCCCHPGTLNWMPTYGPSWNWRTPVTAGTLRMPLRMPFPRLHGWFMHSWTGGRASAGGMGGCVCPVGADRGERTHGGPLPVH